ncbi:MAG: substrate-binding domain-containing protein, partial [Enterococcus gilvus]
LTIEGGYQGATELLRETEVSAIFCCDDMLAIGCYQAVFDSDKVLDQEITVVGFDGGEVTQIVRPKIRSVRQPYKELENAYADKIRMAIQQPDRQMDDRLFHVSFDPE